MKSALSAPRFNRAPDTAAFGNHSGRWRLHRSHRGPGPGADGNGPQVSRHRSRRGDAGSWSQCWNHGSDLRVDRATDAGIQLEPTWLERLAGAVTEAPELDVIYGNFEPLISSRFENYAALAYVPPKQECSEGLIRGPSIASALLRRTVWQNVGGFPDLRAAEDLIFMERIEASGFKIEWVPKGNRAVAPATHLWPHVSQICALFPVQCLGRTTAVLASWNPAAIPPRAAVSDPVLAHSPWWLTVPVVGAVARVAKSIWTRREGRGLLWALNPLQFLGVGLVLATIDLATFLGWMQVLWVAKPRQPAASTPELVKNSSESPS